MTVQKGATFTKDVEFKALDGERRVAIGGVMVPNKVDLHGDFVRPETIEQFSDGFMQRLQSDDSQAVPGVMHAVFPEDHVSLAENRVLDEDREIGGKAFPAGSWIQGWKFDDDELWGLVQDGVLSGYSIGATAVEWSEELTQDDLPDDVEVAADYPADEPVWEILDGDVVEVSSVDIPAVPDAVMVAAKAGTGGQRSLLDHVGGKHEFVGMMQDRGASEDEAERLWHYLQRALADESDGKAAPTPSDSLLTRLGKGVWESLTGAGTAEHGADSTRTADGGHRDTEKESRTLSTANVERLMAAHDAIEDALASEVDFHTNRFTDRPDVDFDVADYGGKAVSTDTHTDAPGGETPDPDSDTTQMSDDTTDFEATLEALEKRLDELEAKTMDDQHDDDAKDADDGVTLEDKLEPLEQKLDTLDTKLEELAEASGKSQQLAGGDIGGSEDGPTKADILGLAGGDGR